MGTLEYNTTTTKFQGGEKLENETRHPARKVYGGRYQSGKRYALKSGTRGHSQKGRRPEDNKDKSKDVRFGGQDLRVPSRFYLPPSRGTEAERRRREEKEELERRKKEIERRRKLELEKRKMREASLKYGGRIQPQVNVAFGSRVPRYESSSQPTNNVRKKVPGTVAPASSALRREAGVNKMEAPSRRETPEEPESTRDTKVYGSLWRKGPSDKKSEMYKHPQELESRATPQNVRTPGARSTFSRDTRRPSCFV